jgi:hypothetical protein
MRRIVTGIAIIIALLVVISAIWIFGGQRLSLLVDRFGTIETGSTAITSISYKGSGNGGILRFNDLDLGLDDTAPPAISPNVGTTKDGQLAVSIGGKVFAFGQLRSSEGDELAADRPSGDNASITTRHSALSWPTPFDFNFMTGQSPVWRRYLYYELGWKKPSDTRLQMVWRYEEYFYSGNGWTSGRGTRQGVTGLVRVDISNTDR